MLRLTNILIACLLFCATAHDASAFSVREWKDSIYGNIKAEAEKGFSDLARQKVSIGSAGGLIVGVITLNRVKFPGLGEADQIILYYNPVKFALNKGDIISSLTSVAIRGGDLKIVRGKDDRWNFMSLVPSNEPGGPPGPAFAGKIQLSDCRI